MINKDKIVKTLEKVENSFVIAIIVFLACALRDSFIWCGRQRVYTSHLAEPTLKVCSSSRSWLFVDRARIRSQLHKLTNGELACECVL